MFHTVTCAYYKNHSTIITTSIQSILDKYTWTQFVEAINKLSYNLIWTNIVCIQTVIPQLPYNNWSVLYLNYKKAHSKANYIYIYTHIYTYTHTHIHIIAQNKVIIFYTN